jgi:hypothetical protein
MARTKKIWAMRVNSKVRRRFILKAGQMPDEPHPAFLRWKPGSKDPGFMLQLAEKCMLPFRELVSFQLLPLELQHLRVV